MIPLENSSIFTYESTDAKKYSPVDQSVTDNVGKETITKMNTQAFDFH